MPFKFFLVLLVIVNLCIFVQMQENPDVVDKITNLPSSFLARSIIKASLENKLTQQTQKYLRHPFKLEKKFQRKLATIDSVGA